MKQIVLFGALLLVVGNFGVWQQIIFSSSAIEVPEAWFLDVGQGDSHFLRLPREDGGEPIGILIDAGPNRKAAEELDKVFGAGRDGYIDLLILTHASRDHYGGFNEILKRYRVGAFIYNGKGSESAGFRELRQILGERNTPVVKFGKGGEIIYLQSSITALSPDAQALATRNANESSLVFIFNSGAKRILFTGDIGFLAENDLLARGYDISADILKVGHHGSRFSSGEAFISAVNPKISVISVGRNSYGHPTRQVLDILERAGSRVYRTDLHGTVRLVLDAI